MNFTFCISRTDSIGDVVLTLPLIGFLKEKFPDSRILFIGRVYTEAILELIPEIDKILRYDDIKEKSEKEIADVLKSEGISHMIHVFPNKKLAKSAKKAGIGHRIGTSHRIFHLLTCNEKVGFTRKNSDLHESQLNFELLQPILNNRYIPSFEEVSKFVNPVNSHSDNIDLSELGLDEDKPILLLHPKSQGSAVEWGIDNFIDLIKLLNEKDIQIAITGTENESEYFRTSLPEQENLFDLSGKLTLPQLISLIESASGIVAASTGPLHIAGMLNTPALGLFSPRRPIHPGRWKPLGENSSTLVFDENCSNCSKGKECQCIQKIRPETVIKKLEEMKIITS